ncbi:protein N-terminal asparagine amidohydrolase-like isoform X2 [Convolutriloba macropyga]|uniref:protein N-terminal asparagine amidohydrolase-like isoform X2 n=1 Tax=Convolutriloba macropyga TaxID=536237 RepID=UPI003F52025B
MVLINAPTDVLDVESIVACCESLSYSTSAFASSPKRKLTFGSPCLYVCQNEFGLIRKTSLTENSPLFIGSDWATTCIVFVLETADRVCCYHLDSPSKAAWRNHEAIQILGKHSNLEAGVKVYAVGGYVDSDENSKETKISKNIFTQSLMIMKLSPVEFDLKLLCCNELNSGEDSKPIHMGMAYSIEEQKVFPADLEECFGPDYFVRSAFSGYAVQNKDEMIVVYEPDENEIRIRPFEVYMNKQQFQYLLSLDDKAFLEIGSTSPKVEPPNFVKNQKQLMQFLLDNYPFMKNLFNNGKSDRVHILKIDGSNYEWELTMETTTS